MSYILQKFRMGKSVETTVVGVHGTGCRALAAPFLAAIGGKVVSDKATREAAMPPLTIKTAVSNDISR